MEDCKPIPVLPYDGWARPDVSTNCNAYQTARKLYEEVADRTVMIETGHKPAPRADADSKVGSGVFVGNGNEVATNVHVALSGEYADVIMRDGKRYHTQIEKIDDTNDVAILKVLDLPNDPKRAINIDSVPLKPGEETVTYGHPRGETDVWASPGFMRARDTMLKLVPDAGSYPDMKLLMDLRNSSDPVAQRESTAYLNAERLDIRANIRNGNSGGPTVDADGHLRALAADRVNNIHSLNIGADKVQKLLSHPENKYSFNYQSDSHGNQKLVSVERLDGNPRKPIYLAMPENKPTTQPDLSRGIALPTDSMVGQRPSETHGGTLFERIFTPFE